MGRSVLQPRPMQPPPGQLRPEIFIEHFERVLDVKNANKDTVRAVLEYRFEQFLALNDEHHREMDSLMESLFSDLEPLLSDEELLRLENERKIIRRGVKGDRVFKPGPGQPPPGDRPPPPPGQKGP